MKQKFDPGLMSRCPYCFFDFGGRDQINAWRFMFTCPNCKHRFVRGKIGYERISEAVLPLVLLTILALIAWLVYAGRNSL